MQFESILSKYTIIFYLLGESCVVSSNVKYKNKSISKCVISYIPIYISLVTIVALTVSGIICELWFSEPSKNTSSAIYVLTCVALIKFVARCQMLTSAKIQPRLITQLKELKHMIQSKSILNAQKFHDQFIRQSTIIISGFIVILTFNITVKHELNEPHFKFVINFCITTFKFMNCVAVCHVHFYTLLLQHFIKTFIDYIQEKSFDIKSKSMCDTIELLSLKIIHFKLYELSIFINTIFGWVFVSIFIQDFVDFIYQMYWIFLFMDCAHNFDILRN